MDEILTSRPWQVTDGNILYAGDTFVALIHRGNAQKIANTVNNLHHLCELIAAIPNGIDPRIRQMARDAIQ